MQEQDDGVLLVDEGVGVKPAACMHTAAPRGMVERRLRRATSRLAAEDLDDLLLQRVAEGKDMANVSDRAAVMATADATANVTVVRRCDARLTEAVLASDGGPDLYDVGDKR